MYGTLENNEGFFSLPVHSKNINTSQKEHFIDRNEQCLQNILCTKKQQSLQSSSSLKIPVYIRLLCWRKKTLYSVRCRSCTDLRVAFNLVVLQSEGARLPSQSGSDYESTYTRFKDTACGSFSGLQVVPWPWGKSLCRPCCQVVVIIHCTGPLKPFVCTKYDRNSTLHQH